MKPAAFDYHSPSSLEAALALLADKADDGARIIAGGQSLVPMMAFRLAAPAHLIDINAIAELNRLAIEDEAISIGACVRHAALEHSAIPGPTGALLRHVAGHVAHYPIRVRGCFCGSLAHADPASEWCLVAVALDATLVLKSAAATRAIAAKDFFEGVMTTALHPDEMLAEARLPMLKPDARFGFEEFSRRHGDFAIASVLTTGRIEQGAIVDARLAIGGAEALPRRMAEAERALEGRTPSREIFTTIGEIAAEALNPLEDAMNDAAFRRDLVRALTPRALGRAFL